MEKYLFDHYYEYNEMESMLKQIANNHPDFTILSSLAKTKENRDIYVMTITNLKTGDDNLKPAFYVDGNHHAGEVTGSMAALHLIKALVDGYSENQAIKELLDKNTVYVIPRVSPDGAESYLTTDNKLRSVNRPYPFKELSDGLHPADIDGDGVIRIMRVKSSQGAWKESKFDSRLMVKRMPADFGGEYYNVYPEGFIINYDGINVFPAENKWGLDFNRNYPFGWAPQARQPGAGDYPLSNIENKAVADFILSHKNICSGVTYHTTGGCYIYPPGTKSEKDADARDMRMFREIGEMATEETGYPCLNIFDAFLTDKVNYSSGAFDDWLYHTQGIPSYTAELWDLQSRAGVENMYPRSRPFTDKEKEENTYKCIKWIDENVKSLKSGKPIKEWEKFNHEQLGEVEIGSYDFKFTYQNCPPEFLNQEMEKNTAFCLRMAQTLPKLSIDSLISEKIDTDTYKIIATFSNNGYLPTFITNEAKALKVDKELVATLDFDGELIIGNKITNVGHLEGFSGIKTMYSYDNIITEKHDSLTKEMIYIIKAKKSQEILFTLGNEKSGCVSKKLVI